MKDDKLSFHVILNNIRSLYNVGSIFRTADAAGCEKLWICGITGHPPNAQISKTALGAQETVTWEYREDIISLVKELKKNGFQIVLLEQIKESKSYSQFIPRAPVCLIVGNEITGVLQELLSLCKEAVEIEMCGLKNSLNVSVAFGIIAYHIRQKLR
ncbi:MAG: RNA methyltransferase [Candidatus Omnitrophota bacterium]